MLTPFPLSNQQLAERLLKAADTKVSTTALAHHLAKAAIERWLAFELAAELDEALPEGWITLVESGATKGLGGIDLLIMPIAATRREGRVRPCTDPWPTNTVAIELKAAHLGDGEAGYRDALLLDLTNKPGLAVQKGRSCDRWLGLVVTTDGLWTGSPNAVNTAHRAEKMKLSGLPVAGGLVRLGASVMRELSYRDWRGSVWFEVFEPEGAQTHRNG